MNLKLDRGEKLALVFAALTALLALGLLFYIPTGPKAKHEASIQDLAQLREELRLTRLLTIDEEQRLRDQEKIVERLEARPPTFDFFAFINRILQVAELQGRATLDNYQTRDISPKQPMVQLELSGVNLEELVEFFHQIYSKKNLVAVYQVNRLRPAPNGRGLNCEFILVTVNV